MEELVEFLQIKLEQDFGYHDDAAIDALQASMEELHKHKLDNPGRAPPHELPQKPFGLIESFLYHEEKTVENANDTRQHETKQNGLNNHAVIPEQTIPVYELNEIVSVFLAVFIFLFNFSHYLLKNLLIDVWHNFCTFRFLTSSV